jgi:hypothetical protein
MAAVAAFVDVAKRYCTWAEGAPLEPSADLHQARLLLAELHVAVLALPTAEPCEHVELGGLDLGAWRTCKERFQQLPVNQYWDVFDPLNADDREPVCTTLADDLADIWGDLRDGLSLLATGRITEAVWEWRFAFNVHWGKHLTSAQRAIHSYCGDEFLDLV